MGLGTKEIQLVILSEGRVYPAKVLLFGEQIVNLGASALATPMNVYSGKWTNKPNTAYQKVIPDFLNYLEAQADISNFLDLSSLKNEVDLFYQADIPIGYGVGSSGAFTAAIFDKYYVGPKEGLGDILHVQKCLASIESYFHGSSSGIDPLVSYLEKSLQILRDKKINAVSILDKTLKPFFLINTGIQRSTKQWVDHFLARANDDLFKKVCHEELIPANEKAIQSIITNAPKKAAESINEISEFQWKYMREFIPDDFQSIWKKGLQENEYVLKICGAGGGGFILGYAINGRKRIEEELKEYTPLFF